MKSVTKAGRTGEDRGDVSFPRGILFRPGLTVFSIVKDMRVFFDELLDLALRAGGKDGVEVQTASDAKKIFSARFAFWVDGMYSDLEVFQRLPLNSSVNESCKSSSTSLLHIYFHSSERVCNIDSVLGDFMLATAALQ